MKATHLMVHCSATPEGRKITPAMISEWHLGPADLAGGKVRYMGRTYDSREDLPDDEINGKLVIDIKGNGWSKVGYSEFVDLEGLVHVLNKHDWDENIDAWEITNGASGWNSKAFHICYAGGMDQFYKPKDTRTWPQKETLRQIVTAYIAKMPDIKLIGHNQVNAHKACPSFDVPTWCDQIGIPDKNIDRKKYV